MGILMDLGYGLRQALFEKSFYRTLFWLPTISAFIAIFFY